MEMPVEKVETPVVKPVEKTETPPVKMAMEKSENLNDITHDFQQTGFNIHPILVVFGIGMAVAIGIILFRNSRKGKELMEKTAPPKKIQTRQVPPRRPIPSVLKQQGVAAVQGNVITNRSTLNGGIV